MNRVLRTRRTATLAFPFDNAPSFCTWHAPVEYWLVDFDPETPPCTGAESNAIQGLCGTSCTENVVDFDAKCTALGTLEVPHFPMPGYLAVPSASRARNGGGSTYGTERGRNAW
eukprot:3091008-Rhodomonas_salina.1